MDGGELYFSGFIVQDFLTIKAEVYKCTMFVLLT